MRTLLAFLIAPASIGIVALVVSILVGKWSEGLWAFGFSAMIAYPVTLIIGIPVFLLLQKLQFTSLLSYLGMGCLLALIPVAFLVIWPILSSSSDNSAGMEILTPHYWQSAIVFAAGLTTVLVFWLIARPDQA